jgi:hypothetical protein
VVRSGRTRSAADTRGALRPRLRRSIKPYCGYPSGSRHRLIAPRFHCLGPDGPCALDPEVSGAFARSCDERSLGQGAATGVARSRALRPPQVKSYLRPLRQQRPSTTASTRARHGDRVQDPVDKHRLLKTLLVPNLPRRSHRIGLALLYVRSCQNEEPEKLLDVKVRSVFVRRTRGYQSRAPGLAGASDGISSNVVDVSMSLLTQCDQPRHIAPPG